MPLLPIESRQRQGGQEAASTQATDYLAMHVTSPSLSARGVDITSIPFTIHVGSWGPEKRIARQP